MFKLILIPIFTNFLFSQYKHAKTLISFLITRGVNIPGKMFHCVKYSIREIGTRIDSANSNLMFA